jgi:predicted esterase
MSRTLNGKLETFYKSMNGKVDNMITSTTQFINKVTNLISTNSESSSSLSSTYKSSAVTNSLAGVNGINSTLGNINNSFGNISSVLSDCSTLLSTIDMLLSKIKTIEANEAKLNSLSNTEENLSTINSLKSCISADEKSYDSLEQSALSLYEKIMTATDEVAASSVSAAAISTDKTLGNLEWKDLGNGWKEAKASFTASNGEKIDYVICVPSNIDTSSNLGLVTWLHHSNDSRNYTVDNLSAENHLYRRIKKYNPSPYNANTVCLFPISSNGFGNSSSKQEALKELTDTVLNTYNIPTSKNAIAGGSLGAIGALAMTASYPGYYKVCIAHSPEYPGNNDRFNSASEFGEALGKSGTEIYSYVDPNDSYRDRNANEEDRDIQNAIDKVGASSHYHYITHNGGHMGMAGKQIESGEFTNLLRELLGI